MQRRVPPCTCSPQSDHQIHKQTAQQLPPVASFASPPLRFHAAPSESAVQRKKTAVGASLSLAQPTTTAEATLPALHPRPKPAPLRHSAPTHKPVSHSCPLSALASLHSMAFMSWCASRSLCPVLLPGTWRTSSLRLINALLFLPGLRFAEPGPHPDSAALQAAMRHRAQWLGRRAEARQAYAARLQGRFASVGTGRRAGMLPGVISVKAA